MRLRRLRFRLKRQGMAELDAWLAGLEAPLAGGDYPLLEAVESLLACEPPELIAMMRGERPAPELLRPWLALQRLDAEPAISV